MPLLHFSLWLVFFINGVVLAAWAPRIPAVAATLGIGDAWLGVALLGVAAGSIPAMLATPALARRLGAVPLCLGAEAIFVLALPLIAACRDAVALGAVLALLGAAGGVVDVTMNTLGVALQGRRGVPLVSGLHAAFSLGVLGGSLSAVAATALGLGLWPHFGAVSAALLVLLALAAPALIRGRGALGGPRVPAPGRVAASGAAARSPRIPLGFVLLALSGLLLEGLVTDWSALLLARDLNAGGVQAAATLAAFSFAMFVSRLAADRLGHRGSTLVVAGSAALVVSAALATLPGVPWLASFSLVVMGLAIGPLFPLAIGRAAGLSPDRVAAAITRLSVYGYGAQLVGPPLIGFLAQGTGLPFAFLLVACAAALVAALTARSAGSQ